MKKKELTIVIGMILSGSLSAQSVEKPIEKEDNRVEQDNVENMGEMKVWGTKVQSSSLNISEEDITIRQADHLSDLLRSLPGVDVGGAHSLNQRINIRGLDDKDLAVSIDGAVQNTYMYHHAGNLQIHADILKSVEVQVGINSVVNGGLGGAVRFETKAAKDLLNYDQQFGGRIQGSFADNDSTGGSMSIYGQLSDKIDFLGYYNYVDRDNYTVGDGKIVGQDGTIINETGEVKGLAGRTNDALIKFGWDMNPLQRLEFGVESYEDAGNYSFRPDMGLATDIAIAENMGLPLTYPTQFTRDTYTLNHEMDLGSSTIVKTSLYYNNSELQRDESGIAAVFPTSPSFVEGVAKNTGFNILGQTGLSFGIQQDITYGLELIDYDTQYSQNREQISGEEATNWALYIEDRISWDNGISLTPGLRFDSYDVNSTVVNNTFDDVTFGLAFEYNTDRFSFKLSSTELFKGPELAEVFVGAGINDAANAEIDAETGINHQMSLTYEADYGFHLGVTLFQTNINDYIYEYEDDNIGDLTIDGYELYVHHKAGNLSSMLSHAAQDSELSAFAEFSGFNGARLDRSIGDSTNLSFDYQLPSENLNVHWNTQYIGSLSAQPDLDELNNPKKSYTVHNVSMKWYPQKQLKGIELTLGVDNLFDKHYASHASRTGDSFHPRFGNLHLTDYEPGRNVKATIAYKF